MPVLRQHHVGEPRGEAVDQRNDLITMRHAQRAAGTEVVLDIDDDEDVIVTERRAFVHDRTLCAPDGYRARRSTSAASFTSSSATSTEYVAFGSRRRKGSDKRSSSRLVRSRMSASVSGGRNRRPSRMTGWMSGSPGLSWPSSAKISPAMRPSAP